jgi:hypothetical protein
MTLTPQLDATDFIGPAKMVSVAMFAEPALLAGGLAGLSASGLGTITLAIQGPRIGDEELRATAAFASAQRAAHREPYPVDPGTGGESKKEDRKKNQT